MGEVYVFSPNENDNDYATMGLVGALTPTKCLFKETANGESILTLEHPLDAFGRYAALEKGNVLVAPVPVRTTPEIQNGRCVTTVWTYRVKPLNQLTSKNQRTLYKKSRGNGRKKIMKSGESVTVVQIPRETTEITRWKAKTKYGTGWIDPNGVELVTEHKIENNANAIEEIQSPWTVSEQYFRIYEVTKSLDGISVSARHISYDLLYEVTSYYNGSDKAVDLKTTIERILGQTYGSQENFHGYTNVDNSRAGQNWRGRNIIDCFLDPENGVCAQYNVNLIRDNYDLYFLHDPGLNRGVRIQYGKNMTGIEFTSSDDEIATRIIPIGENKNGEDFFLSSSETEQYVDSPLIDSYPIKHVLYLKCDNCKIGDKDENGGTITQSVARARMREQAQKKFEEGCDKPKITLDIEYINLGDTEEYKQFKNLENLFLFDYVIVQHPDLGIDVTAQVTGIEWNVLIDRMEKTTVGSVGMTMANSGITSWQIPSGFSGSKIAGGTVGSGALKSDIINARHMQAESINTEALQALCVTAAKIAAGAITADKLDVDTVDAKIANIALANLTTANIEKANIQWADIANLSAAIARISKAHLGDVDIDWAKIDRLSAAVADIAQAKIDNATIDVGQIDRLTAAVADIVHQTVGTGEFTLAEVQNLLAKALVLEQGSANTMMIKNLIVTEANLLNATIRKLIMPGTDGKYYEITVGTDGIIHTEEVSVTPGEIEAGKTEGGQQITSTAINAGAIDGTAISAQQATIHSILTSALSAGKITAGDALIASATIPTLYADSISSIGNSLNLSANESVKIMVGEAAKKAQQAQDTADKAISGVTVLYTQTDSSSTAPPASSKWSTVHPEHAAGKYIWQKTVTTYNSGLTSESDPVCLSGADGEPATTLRLDSSRGTVFKNNAVSTVLSVVIYRGGERITTPEALRATFGAGAYLQWSWQRVNENRFGYISSSDSRLSNGGFQFTITPADVDTKVTFMCELIL